MNESWPAKTIYTPSGEPYLSVIDQGEIVALQLHRYSRVVVTLDRKVIPELIEHLKELE